MVKYSAISIIYNPKSTGGSKQVAEKLQDELREKLPNQLIETTATRAAGDAEKLAYTLAKATSNPLIISASGDGGYNEIVNGIMRAQAEGASATSGLLPAGNANDHYHSLHKQDFVTAVVDANERSIDLLHFKVSGKKSQERYAHSYIGLGFTPHAGRELNKAKLSRFQDMLVVAKAFLRSKTYTITMDGEQLSYRSLVFSNIDRMAKVLTLSSDSSADDGKFEIGILASQSKLGFGLLLARASLHHAQPIRQSSKVRLSTLSPTLFQLDGEIMTIDANSEITIRSERRALRCII